MDVPQQDNADMLLTNFARYLINIHDGRHAEWVLFCHGSLYIQTMPSNEETAVDQLVKKANESLKEVIIEPGGHYGDATIYTMDYENKQIYYANIETFLGVILLHPSQQIQNDIMALMAARINILNDKENPIVVSTGNTKTQQI
ncbi:unnamed protein product [Adineta steineri]|uniref:Uncharacterized protein n=1 Tax=Adineta steineri TaxID=433720 RepID=A0A815BSP1_9BILA|nr:unnamed protein product [Adineta steineri]CAF1274113.1 unnamed protein product [Adineta steineri]